VWIVERYFSTDFEMINKTLIRGGEGDIRVQKFYERAAKNGPTGRGIYCDSVAK